MYKKVHFLYIVYDPLIKISINSHICPFLPLAATGVVFRCTIYFLMLSTTDNAAA